jgi:hypothetical protein
MPKAHSTKNEIVSVQEKMMSYLAKAALCAAALCAPLLFAPIGAQAVPAGVKSLPRIHGAVLVRRVCIAWERDDEGNNRCVNWEECGPNVC